MLRAWTPKNHEEGQNWGKAQFAILPLDTTTTYELTNRMQTQETLSSYPENVQNVTEIPSRAFHLRI